MHCDHRKKAVSISVAAGWGTILLVDDDAAVRNLTRTMLERLGYDVLTAQGGTEAIEIFEAYAHLVRLVISDLEMPGITGWEVLSAIRRRGPGIPVILTSGYNEIPGGLQWGDDRPPIILKKPYTLNTVGRFLENALSETLPYTSNPYGSKTELSHP